MKKGIIYFIVGIVGIITISSCSSGNGNTDAQKNYHQKVYQDAIDIKDLPTAIVSLRYILALDTNNSKLWDTLAHHYYTVGQVAQAILVCNQFEKKFPLTEQILETKELCFEKLGALDSAITIADKLFLKTQKPKYTYRTGYYKLQMGDPKGYEYLDKVIAIKEKINDSTEMRFGQAGMSQMVPIKAAALFVKGTALGQEGKHSEGKIYLQKSINEFPDFYYAKGLLQNYDQYVKEYEMQKRMQR